ncbi:MAG: Gfo/Idh/MocA family oxidoreductase [Verrucomicrobiota bacterium]|jgi:hypothetical protein
MSIKESHPLESSPANGLSRRKFIQRASLAVGASAFSFPYVGKVLGANDRINLACIGCAGKGDSDTNDAARCGANIVALCDVDTGNLAKKVSQFADKYPDLKQFRDYRQLFDKMGKDIDAVTISTPDHNHGVAAIRAMKMGKHCFCQKPLVQTVHEARVVRQLAKEKNLATQMGNQGSAASGLRRAVEVLQAGVIGAPRELHVWTNRPIWPQGLARPAGQDIVPASLDWEVWLGPAHKRPYKEDTYHQFKWRAWFDFGTGALGDMACHTVNMPFRGLKLGYPDVVECEMASRIYPETFPKTSRIRFDFPEREGLPPLKFWWYDGNPKDDFKPLRPDAGILREVMGIYDDVPRSGALIIGDKGQLFSPDDYGAEFYLALHNDKDFVPGDEHEAVMAVPRTLPRSPGHMKEWFKMMKDGTPAYSNFDIAGYLAEVILLGCVAVRLGEGQRMEWDGPKMKSPNQPGASRFLQRHNRHGWEA